MKKTLLLTLFILFALPSFAQKEKSNFKLGIKSGVNYSWITNTTVKTIDPDVKTGLFLGLFGEVKLAGEKLIFQPELVYSRQGNYYDNDPEYVWYRLNYLNVPLVLKIKIYRTFYLEGGAQVGFLLNAKEKYKLHGDKSLQSLTEHIESNDFSLIAGLGWRVNRWDMNLRFNIGLTNTFKGETAKMYFDSDHTKANIVMQMGIGFRL